MIHGLIPGPELFTLSRHNITYGFILSLFLANIVFLAIVGLYFAPYFSKDIANSFGYSDSCGLQCLLS